MISNNGDEPAATKAGPTAWACNRQGIPGGGAASGPQGATSRQLASSPLFVRYNKV